MYCVSHIWPISAVHPVRLRDASDAKCAEGVSGERADQVFQVRLLHHGPGNMTTVTALSLSYYEVSR